jgi:hypothetical protein
MSAVIVLIVVAGMLLIIARQSNLKASKPVGQPNPNANEPDVFANDSADLDPESDTGDPEGWN